MFSSRVPARLDRNALSRALQAAMAAGHALIDLTATNPTTAGFEYPDALFSAFRTRYARVYQPTPFGLPTARAAVAREYTRRGIAIAPERIVLTSSTSEAYSLLFKLLCESSGDAVLTPVPSYPLFEHLTRLDGVMPVAYLFEYHGRWMLDPESVDAAWTPRTRAVLAVSPNNPTGSVLSIREIEQLSTRCAERDAALIVDEVFADYPLVEDGSGRAPSNELRATSPESGCLMFRLGGLSKAAGLPQVKLGWIAVEGPDVHVAGALERLEFICDAYLSVSTPVQLAAETLINEGAQVRRQIAARVRSNYERLRELAAPHPAVDVLSADGGWSAVVRVPARWSEEQLVLELLERDAVVAHPGFFFDFPREAYLVLSLLPPAPMFEEGVVRVFKRVGG